MSSSFALPAENLGEEFSTELSSIIRQSLDTVFGTVQETKPGHLSLPGEIHLANYQWRSVDMNFKLDSKGIEMTTLEEAFTATVTMKVKPPHLIRESMSSSKAMLAHMAMGISGEAGELMDAIKKHVVYDRPLDEANVLEELGDLEFYMEGLRLHLGVSRKRILQMNMEKLNKRYSGAYSDQEAAQRKDKA